MCLARTGSSVDCTAKHKIELGRSPERKPMRRVEALHSPFMRSDNAELEHNHAAAARPSEPGHGSVQMTALVRVDTQPGRERPLVIAWLAGIVALCWACLVFQALHISSAEPASLAHTSRPLSTPPYRAYELVLVLAMWGAMLSAMVLPAATPAILLFARINRLAQSVRHPNLATLLFVGGYLAV
ncbi:MAG TPA: hypothetical protein DDZ22_12080, partial [Massilia sp.]|nr:hypothetical protein [Massilia sp.]